MSKSSVRCFNYHLHRPQAKIVLDFYPRLWYNRDLLKWTCGRDTLDIIRPRSDLGPPSVNAVSSNEWQGTPDTYLDTSLFPRYIEDREKSGGVPDLFGDRASDLYRGSTRRVSSELARTSRRGASSSEPKLVIDNEEETRRVEPRD